MIAPVIHTKESLHLAVFRLRPWQHGAVAQIDELLGLDEGLEHARRKPGMLLHERAADAHDMHDREDHGALEIVELDGGIVWKEMPDLLARIGADETARRPRADQRIDLSALQHVGKGAVWRNHLPIDAVRHGDRRTLLATRLVAPARTPTDGAHIDAVHVIEDTPDPDIRRLLELGQPDGLTAQI